MLMLTIFNYFLAKNRRGSPFRIIAQHVFTATLVIIITHYLGIFTAIYLG